VGLDEWSDPALRPGIVARLKAFAPDFVLGIPNAGYPLLFCEGAGEQRRNLFTDLLSVRVVLPWDHLLTQAPAYYLDERLLAEAPRPGALETLRRHLENPLLRHYGLDSAHTRIYEDLGVLAPGRVRRYFSAAHREFLDQGVRRQPPSVRGRVGFAGNVYLARGSRLPMLGHPLLRHVDEVVRAAKRADWQVSGWHLLCQALEQVPAELRHALGLTPDYGQFWRIALDLLRFRVNTEFRLAVLQAVPQPVDFYGNFNDPESSPGLDSTKIRFCDSADFRTELPRVYAAYEVWVDATNAPFIHGCGGKVFDCFAAGSLMLIDYRKDLHAELGELGLSFMYRNADELQAKVAYYAGNPKARADLIEAMQRVIREGLTREHFYRRVCRDMAADAGAPAPPVAGAGASL
jgi:hypothetical protein